jgi:3(or 17)beta-hydroxysteroid dehydrogenase
MKRLNQRVALITGGAAGIGRAIASRLAAEGAQVVISDVQSGLGQATAAAHGIEFLVQDVSDEAQWHAITDRIERQFGRLDILVNNAGILGPMNAATPENTNLADWKRIFAINAEGVFLGCRAAISAMRRTGGGAIVNISSVAGLTATPMGTAYGASKAAVWQLTRSVAQHCAQERLNIRCNSVHPGYVRTAIVEKIADERAAMWGVSAAQILSDTEAAIPLGRFTTTDDIAAAVAYLVSDDARQITGTQLVVDGGETGCDSFQRHSDRRPPPAEHAAGPER